ncbi:uncharacterized protein KQ657_005000 [Scheffersomyces spartinae]|uniref:Uncharacterized protein n=1 Tax=Scheffersomyces spartinae TaxID=45513 RepID=A0A9P7VAB3_9ASCO|nr:uncharacterized protein KQ657_005000 [Scheffersomyces spartinae]KAG7194273.1 hypothetical protein KQ657_005000 [Scheffersomyces spartinae]
MVGCEEGGSTNWQVPGSLVKVELGDEVETGVVEVDKEDVYGVIDDVDISLRFSVKQSSVSDT